MFPLYSRLSSDEAAEAEGCMSARAEFSFREMTTRQDLTATESLSTVIAQRYRSLALQEASVGEVC